MHPNLLYLHPNRLSAHVDPAATRTARPDADAENPRPLRGGHRAGRPFHTAPVVRRRGFRADGAHGPAAALLRGAGGDAPHGGIRRGAAPGGRTGRAAGRTHCLRGRGGGNPRRPGPLRRGRSGRRALAGPRDGALASVGRPGDALRRFAHSADGRRAVRVPRRGAALPGRGGELPPPDAAAGIRRNALRLRTHAARTAARTHRKAPPPRGGAAGPASARRGCGSRGAGHGGGRPERHHAGAAHGLLAQRAVAPAGRIGTPHGHRLRARQSRAVVAAASQAGTPRAQRAGGGGRVAVRRGGGSPAERRAGRRHVYGPADRFGVGIGIRRTQCARRGGFRDAALAAGLAGGHQLPALVPRRGGHTRLGRAALPPLPDALPGGERRDRRLPDRPRGRRRHDAPRLAHLRNGSAGRAARQSRGHRTGDGRSLRRGAVDAPARRTARPGLRPGDGHGGRRDQRAGPPHGLAAGRRGRICARRDADRDPLPPLRARYPRGMERGTEKSVHLPT